jgi:prevent-host-death family protein
MSNTVGIRELRQQTSAVLQRVAAGETIEITEHGHPVARLVPLHSSPLEQLALEGRVTGAEGDLLELLDELSLPAAALGPELPSRSLAALRADEE